MPTASTLDQERAAPEAKNEEADRDACVRPRPTSQAARPTSRAQNSIWITPPSARRSAASSAPRWSAKARWWCRTIAQSLATIQQLDPIYADFTQSVNELNQLRRAFETGELDRISPDAMKVRLVLDDGDRYPLPGKLLFSDAKVDANTGQVTLRGEFPNPKRELLPGMYVRVQIEQGIDCDAIAVPQQAIQRNGGGGSEVFVVKDDGHVAIQPVRTGSLQDGLWFVTEGLKSGDKVVVEGFPEVRRRRQGQAAILGRSGRICGSETANAPVISDAELLH